MNGRLTLRTIVEQGTLEPRTFSHRLAGYISARRMSFEDFRYGNRRTWAASGTVTFATLEE